MCYLFLNPLSFNQVWWIILFPAWLIHFGPKRKWLFFTKVKRYIMHHLHVSAILLVVWVLWNKFHISNVQRGHRHLKYAVTIIGWGVRCKPILHFMPKFKRINKCQLMSGIWLTLCHLLDLLKCCWQIAFELSTEKWRSFLHHAPSYMAFLLQLVLDHIFPFKIGVLCSLSYLCMVSYIRLALFHAELIL